MQTYMSHPLPVRLMRAGGGGGGGREGGADVHVVSPSCMPYLHIKG